MAQTFNAAKVSLALCLFLAVAGNSFMSAQASSIPIWEFLTRNEKMSYLYSHFAQLVSVHCKTTAATSNTPVNQCKHDLLNYGYEKLQTFTDNQLEALDPYQRNSENLIWTSIMRDHPSSQLITTRKPQSLPTPPATSIIILTHQQPSTPKSQPGDTTMTTTTTTATSSETQYPHNPMFDSSEQKHQYAMDMDIAYGYPSMAHNPQVDVFDIGSVQKTYLTGPSVVRVKPDGTPVEEDKNKPAVKDDDLEHFVNTGLFARDNVMTKAPSSSNSGSTTTPTATTSANGKHRKIATINALKQQYLTNLAMQQQQLLPPYENARSPRQAY
ncbi:rhythmically expressed gene 5 protein [Musca vetustissima]|uniref:rhythmically expressed gene 5 protein n=1 Tax=Musca vetustissima TaxID=27455 RepID=UPI002AB76F6D|nr:rhythmically expressed gene 5 protein [Musca vetustissima]